jgi:NADH-quinone oxidoreductase subunit L
MAIPLMVLAALSIAAGYIGMPGHNFFAEVIKFEGVSEHEFSILIAAMGTLAALLGIGLASIIWIVPVLRIEKLASAFGWVQTLVANKYYMDETYDIVIIRPLMAINRVMYAFDRWVIDHAIVNGTGWITMQLAKLWAIFDRHVVDGLVNLVGAVTKLGGRSLKYVQTGIVQQYALILVGCLVIVGWYFVLLR